ncbi:NYN domain-containing protein [Microbacterium sp. NPDC087665]|uniref:NYN domain-containing protein n=1 Tax=Microbacterium sp. NPDC087665 TaxID=3364194 RepID=UPI003810E0CD
MAETTDIRVAVYLDFDNIVISWYDRVHGRNAYGKDRQRIAENPHDPEVAERLSAAMIEVGAIIDYAASFGTLVLTRAYADWSSPVNAVYRSQLVARAVDLVQLFPAAAYAKNGADIRLAVDAVEDMFRLPDLTHVVIVAGDSDYVPLAQRCKRLGRYVIGVGVAGSTAKSLAAACDEFEAYDSLPGVHRPVRAVAPVAEPAPAAVEEAVVAAVAEAPADAPADAVKTKSTRSRRAKSAPATPAPEPEPVVDPQNEATQLLERALRLGHDKADADEWLHSSAVKTHMRRMDPSFSEKGLGYRSFSDFLKSRDDIAELEETGHERLVRLREQ